MKYIFLIITVLLMTVAFGLAAKSNVLAADNCQNSSTTEGAISCGVGGTTGVPVTPTPAKKINNTVAQVVNIISIVGGILAVIFVIVGGYKYVTSGGDSSKVSSAKSTVMYALVGLVVVALAQILVKFVLSKST